jgi:hypothetical protein
MDPHPFDTYSAKKSEYFARAIPALGTRGLRFSQTEYAVHAANVLSQSRRHHFMKKPLLRILVVAAVVVVVIVLMHFYGGQLKEMFLEMHGKHRG